MYIVLKNLYGEITIHSACKNYEVVELQIFAYQFITGLIYFTLSPRYVHYITKYLLLYVRISEAIPRISNSHLSVCRRGHTYVYIS